MNFFHDFKTHNDNRYLHQFYPTKSWLETVRLEFVAVTWYFIYFSASTSHSSSLDRYSRRYFYAHHLWLQVGTKYCLQNKELFLHCLHHRCLHSSKRIKWHIADFLTWIIYQEGLTSLKYPLKWLLLLFICFFFHENSNVIVNINVFLLDLYLILKLI